MSLTSSPVVTLRNAPAAPVDDPIAAIPRYPGLACHVGQSCVVRNGLVSPRCTEGKHFCGVPVWNSFPNVERRL